MQLAWIKFKNYRRFSQEQTLRLSGKLTALVGPNESGKSSLLRLLSLIGHDEEFDDLDVTKGEGLSMNELRLEAAFFLDDSDRSEIAGIPGSKTARWLRVTKSADGSRVFSLEPALERDLNPRRRVARELRRALKHPRFEELTEGASPDEDGDGDISAIDVLEVLEAETQDLAPRNIQAIRTFAGQLETHLADDAPKYIKKLPEILSKQAEVESQHNPNVSATDRLKARLPAFAFFDEENRILKPSYDLAAVSDAPPAALKNLASLASLRLQDLLATVQTGDQADINTLQTRASEKLAERFKWSQTRVRVEFLMNGTELNIQIRDEDDRFSGLDERSDGLRQFVALLAFFSSQSVANPVLLIDEPEAHLHYDAQADLIDTLAKQQLTARIIYTTHSMGCLPEDLGSGIRLLAIDPPVSGTRSIIQDRFWSDNQAGLTSLLFGMGATTLAFLPMRAALLVEGPSDLILLPSIFKELSGKDHLGFQIVPGLSTASRKQVPALKSHGSRVLYLVDNDRGGRDLRKWLKRQEVDPDHILDLAPKESTLSSVEDAIDSVLFTDAVNRHLERWDSTGSRLRPNDLPRSKRWMALKAWCKRNGYEVPGKPDLAYQIIDVLSDEPDRKIIDRQRSRILDKLLKEIEGKFEEALRRQRQDPD